MLTPRLASAIAVISLITGLAVIPSASAAADDASFCGYMKDLGASNSCGELIPYAHSACAQFDNGTHWYPILMQLYDALGQDTGSGVMTVAVSEICPWNEAAANAD